jgi:hypothetical protein
MTLLTRWEPLRDFSILQDRMNLMNRLFRESYSPEGPEEALTTTNFAPPVDIYEDEHTITLKRRSRALTKRTLMSASRTTPSPSTASARSRRKRKNKTSVALSGNMEASPVPTRCPVPWIQDK